MADNIIWNVRQQSSAGWFLGGLCFSEDNAECCDKDSSYFPTEESLKKEYPNSVSFE